MPSCMVEWQLHGYPYPACSSILYNDTILMYTASASKDRELWIWLGIQLISSTVPTYWECWWYVTLTAIWLFTWAFYGFRTAFMVRSHLLMIHAWYSCILYNLECLECQLPGMHNISIGKIPSTSSWVYTYLALQYHPGHNTWQLVWISF